MWLVCNLRTRDRFERKPRNPVYDVINPFQLWKGILSPIFNYWPILQVNHVNLVSFFITFFIYILFTFCLRNKHMSLLILVFRFLSSFILILLHCSSVLLSFLFWFFLLSVEQKNPLCMCCNYVRKTTCLYSYSPFRVSQIQDMYSFNPIQLKTTNLLHYL